MDFNTEKNVKRPYEGIIIVHPDATEEEQKSLFKKNKEIIEQFGGTWNHIDTWGKRTLANTINDHRRAHYFHCTFETNPKAISEMERTMHINDRVLRYQHVRLDERFAVGKHLENYREVINNSIQREKERAEKADKNRRAKRGPRES